MSGSNDGCWTCGGADHWHWQCPKNAEINRKFKEDEDLRNKGLLNQDDWNSGYKNDKDDKNYGDAAKLSSDLENMDAQSMFILLGKITEQNYSSNFGDPKRLVAAEIIRKLYEYTPWDVMEVYPVEGPWICSRLFPDPGGWFEAAALGMSRADIIGKGKGDIIGKGKGKGHVQAAPTPSSFASTTSDDPMPDARAACGPASGSKDNVFEEQGPFPLGTFPPGSFPAQQQRLYENLPKQLKDAYRKEANGHGPMSSDEKNAYDHLAQIFSQMEATNTWIEMCMERRPGKKRDRDLVAWHAQLADQMKEWEDFAKEPVKVIGSVS